MPNKFDQDTVQQYGGVAWAKEQISLLQPGAIDSQIQGYNQVRDSLNEIIRTLNHANASLQSAWSGDAANAAGQTFSETSNHAQTVVTAVSNTISQLENAKSAAHDAQAAMRNVPNEVPVPDGGLFGSISNAVSDVFTGTDPKKQAEQHNTAARNQAAEVLNKLSNSYDTAASNMHAIANTKPDDGGFHSTTTPEVFNLGSGSGGGSGAAASYSRSFSNGAGTASSSGGGGTVKGGVFQDTHTTLQSVTTLPEPNIGVPFSPESVTTTTTTITPEPYPINVDKGLTKPPSETKRLGPITEETPLEEGLGGAGRSRGSSKLGGGNVFGEEGFGNESGGGVRRRGGGLGNGAFEGERQPSSGGQFGGANGEAAGEEQSGMRPGAGGRGGGGAMSEEELGSSKYSRGRFFGGDEPGEVSEHWVQPSVGGNESLLVKDGKSGSGTGRVRSAYDGATDAEGNPLHMLRSAAARGGRDEDDERGQRPDYLKEDPEWWQSAERVAPPVVE